MWLNHERISFFTQLVIACVSPGRADKSHAVCSRGAIIGLSLGESAIITSRSDLRCAVHVLARGQFCNILLWFAYSQALV